MRLRLQPLGGPKGERPRVAAVAAANATASVENRWCQLRALDVLVCASCQHQHWFNDNNAIISNPLTAKNCLLKTYVNRPIDENKAAFHRSHRLVQHRLREMQDTWTVRRVKEIHGYADRNEWRSFIAAIRTVKAVHSQRNRSSSEHRWNHFTHGENANSTLMAELFRGVLNHPSTIFDAAIASLPQTEPNAGLDIPSCPHKIIIAMKQLSSWKTSGLDATPAEIYEQICPQLMNQLTVPFQEMWRQDEVRLNNHLKQGLLTESQ
nr:unnamed protein product [Spirometra erinaceieuropaei]